MDEEKRIPEQTPQPVQEEAPQPDSQPQMTFTPPVSGTGMPVPPLPQNLLTPPVSGMHPLSPDNPPPAPPVAMKDLPPISRAEAEQCRHKCEKRWYRRLVILNILLIVGVIAAVCAHTADYKKQYDELYDHVMEDVLTAMEGEETDTEESEDSDDYYEEFAEDFPIELQLFFGGLLGLIVGYLALYYYFAYVRAMSLKITPRNFPEVYELIESFARRLGMEKVPDTFVVQQNGILNAFSSFILRRQYIQINSEIFEAAYREHHDLESVAFVIAHEIAHIYYGHSTLHYNLWIWFSENIPLFGAIASRTREYSCDRLAQRLTNNDGIDAMLMLVVDRHLYKMVDKRDYVEEAAKQRGFFIWLVNLFADHPVMCKRIRALAMWNGSGELY